MSLDLNVLVEKLRNASHAYYTEGNSPMSDEEYDSAVELLRKLAPESPFLSEVGPTPSEDSVKVYHPIPMGTLSKYHTDEEVITWIQSTKALDLSGVMISPKYDGFGVELVYQDGKLCLASTRGDGYIGEDITEAVSHIKSIPQQILNNFVKVDGTIVIRGEAIIPCEKREFFESRGYKSLRNTVPGIVRSKTTDLLEYVHFVAYNAFGGTFEHHLGQATIRDTLYRLGFEVEDYRVIKTSFGDLKSLYEFYKDLAGSMYEFDGVVLKDNRVQPDDWKLPTHQVAWKFQSKVQVTTLRGIEYPLGTTGKITPIAIFDPVVFQGATLTRASLGSYARFKTLLSEKGMKVGSQIAVTRQGDIIPYVQDVIDSAGYDGDVTEILIPTTCPSCGELLSEVGQNLFCKNKKDPVIVTAKLGAYLSGIRVKGIGQGILSKLVEEYSLGSISDAYRLDPRTVDLKGWGGSLRDKWEGFRTKPLQLIEILSNYPLENCGGSTWAKILDSISASPVKSRICSNTIQGLFDGISIKGISQEKLKSIESQLIENQEDLCAIINQVCQNV